MKASVGMMALSGVAAIVAAGVTSCQGPKPPCEQIAPPTPEQIAVAQAPGGPLGGVFEVEYEFTPRGQSRAVECDLDPVGRRWVQEQNTR